MADTVLVWEERECYLREFPVTIQAKAKNAFDWREDVLEFCTEHLGQRGVRWQMATEGSEIDFGKGRFKKVHHILCFKTEADMILVLTGMDR